MARRVYSEIGKFKRVEASLRGVSAALVVSQREIEEAMAGTRTEAERAVLQRASDRNDQQLIAARDAHRQFWFAVEELG